MVVNPAKAVAYALTKVGKTYQFAAAGPDRFDCSGLIAASWLAGGVVLPHQSGQQAKQVHAVPATAANKKQLRPGDLVFYYGSVDEPASITHVAIYVGRSGPLWMVVAAVDERYGVKKHRMNWALKPSGFGYVR